MRGSHKVDDRRCNIQSVDDQAGGTGDDGDDGNSGCDALGLDSHGYTLAATVHICEEM